MVSIEAIGRRVILSILHPRGEPKVVVIKRLEKNGKVIAFPRGKMVQPPDNNLDSITKRIPPQGF